MKLFHFSLASLFSLIAICLPAFAQAKQPATALSAMAVSQSTVTVLSRNTIIALNNANITGNYTTFRDLAAPSFQARNNAATLSMIFAAIRKQNLDLAPVVVFTPVLTQPAVLNRQGLLLLTGYFPTKPVQLNFSFSYQKIQNKWKLFGISFNPVRLPAPTATAKPTPSKKKSKSKSKASEKK